MKVVAEIVAAYVYRNSIPASELPGLITRVHEVIVRLGSGVSSSNEISEALAKKPTSAQIRMSVRENGIVSFIDGKTYKTLKRHLTAHGLNPRSYCERYGLPADYPMTAPSYSELRSTLARSIGLGQPGALARGS